MNELQQPTLEDLVAEIQALKERVEDLEDLRDLETAIEMNAGKPLTDWNQAKKELDSLDNLDNG